MNYPWAECDLSNNFKSRYVRVYCHENPTEKSLWSSALQSFFCGRSWALQRISVWILAQRLTRLFLSVSMNMMPAAIMQQSKKDATSPTNFIFSLYNLGTWFFNIFPSCSETCDRQTHECTPGRNIAEEYLGSGILTIHPRIIDAAEISDCRCLTLHQASRVTPKKFGHTDRSKWVSMIHWKSTSVATLRGSLIPFCRVSISLQIKKDPANMLC